MAAAALVAALRLELEHVQEHAAEQGVADAQRAGQDGRARCGGVRSDLTRLEISEIRLLSRRPAAKKSKEAEDGS